MNSRRKYAGAVSVLIGVALLWSWGLGALPLFDWDEINFAEIAREMTVRGDFLQPTINFLPFYEKPPFFAWLQVGAYQLFGVGAFGARFPNIACGVLTLGLLGWYGRRRGVGGWWAAFYAGSLLPTLYFRSGIIDPWFNLFILLALLPVFRGGRLSPATVLACGLSLGLAVLTKGPVAGLVVALVYAITLRRRGVSRILPYLGVGLLALLPGVAWLWSLSARDGGAFLQEFTAYQWRLLLQEDAGHGGFPGYHVVVLLLGCFPASVFAVPALFRWRVYGGDVDRGLRILFWVVLILFSLVNTKIVHYSSLCYYPLTWFAARWTVTHRAELTFPRRLLLLLRSLWGVYLLALVALAVAAWTMSMWLPKVGDAELASRLRLPVAWPWYTIVPALVVVAIFILDRRPDLSVRRRAGFHLVGMFVLCLLGLPIVLPRIQAYTQGAALEFYGDLRDESVYLTTARYKSYTPLFYGRVSAATAGRPVHAMLTGPIDRDVYFSSPLRLTDRALADAPGAEILYRRGGFTFFRRRADP
ncbi:ArnT family glycosyltransferase [Lewinella sp. IMCC34183]|uniref:ArnT family glycosyltransferase n=1 Tax=Lewinella sp. IMCC34183 TaxID=2248762 RepID=UPI000E2209EB|nr:glycosyltransferase family 39 protein [Lewinella sp. IMCC34183]